MKNYIYIFTVTYSFDSDYIAKKCDSYEEAVKMLNEYLNEEVETVQRESEYTPSVIRNAEDDVILIYAEGETENYHTEDYACYKVFEVEI